MDREIDSDKGYRVVVFLIKREYWKCHWSCKNNPYLDKIFRQSQPPKWWYFDQSGTNVMIF
jgi:hypothetical protein